MNTITATMTPTFLTVPVMASVIPHLVKEIVRPCTLVLVFIITGVSLMVLPMNISAACVTTTRDAAQVIRLFISTNEPAQNS
jgi:hypothetical protein